MSASRPFPARYDGECAECDGAIFEGELIVMVDGAPLCEDCAPDDEPKLTTFPL